MDKSFLRMVLRAAVLSAAYGWAAAACEGDLYVAVTGDPDSTDGSHDHPYRTITPAVERARQIRATCADPIIVHVGPGDYFGSAIAGSPTMDALPIVIDVADLDLRGSTVLDIDERGLPTGGFSNGTTFTLRPSDDTGVLSTLLIVTPSDSGGAADGVTIEGFVFTADGGKQSASYVTAGIAIDRANNFLCRGNIVMGCLMGTITRASSGRIEGNYMKNDNIGLAATGGNGSYPATVTVTGNRSISNVETGLALVAAGDSIFPPIIARPQNTVNETFDTLVVSAIDNDFNNESLYGIRVLSFGLNTLVTTSQMTAIIEGNTIDKNPFGISMDAGFPNRSVAGVPNPSQFTSAINATFQNNVISNSSTNPALLTFTRASATLDPQSLLVPDASGGSYKYVQNSSYIISHTGELDDVWIDHPEQDPVDCRTLRNTLEINGVEMPPPIRSAELGPAFLQSFVPMAPFSSACPPRLSECAPQL